MRNNGLQGVGVRDRVNLSCLVDALSKFTKAPEKEGEIFYLHVETMAHKIHKTRRILELGKKGPVAFIQVKLMAVLYEMPDGQQALTWEVV